MSRFSRLSLPSKKFFVKQLTEAVEQQNGALDAKVHQWSVIAHSKHIDFSIVWIQGTVISVDRPRDTLIIDDDTGTIEVVGLSKLPQGCPTISKGSYIMVIGELIQSGRNASIHAIKIQDRCRSKKVENSWILEVIDSQQLT
ncbi:unnamed protein product [Owenia fusiformis]|uniref:RecQ-mediated genome instability protein 2 n=1 Tax=Owenia fusiformis TaxID=6347 RepID=A0A8S4N2I8_OWEFU|nr:unnamed protein product [Owenia fusiformis]